MKAFASKLVKGRVSAKEKRKDEGWQVKISVQKNWKVEVGIISSNFLKRVRDNFNLDEEVK